MTKAIFKIEEKHEGMRIDRALSLLCPDRSRSSFERLISEGMVTVKGKAVNKSYKAALGDEIIVTLPGLKPLDAAPQPIGLDIVYEDECLLVVNKPRGMVVHPAPGNRDRTLVNALLHHCGTSLSGINGVIRPGIVHRIDKDTSGLLIVAKNDAAHISLGAQIKAHSFTRIYESVLCGTVKEMEGTVDAPIGRNKNDRKKMCVTTYNSKSAVTHFKVLKYLEGGYTHVQCRLETGRTHQIRVHMAHMGHPVAGDPLYGPKRDKTGVGSQLLHAGTIGFIHPKTGEYMEFHAPPPQYFIDFIKSHGGLELKKEGT